MKGDDGEYTDQTTPAQYMYLNTLGEGEHPMALTEQVTTVDQAILLEDS